MNKSKITTTHHSSSVMRRSPQHSSALNRKYVKRPTSKITRRGYVDPIKKPINSSSVKVTTKPAPIAKTPANAKLLAAKPAAKLSAQERKSQAIKHALRSVSTMERREQIAKPLTAAYTAQNTAAQAQQLKPVKNSRFNFKHLTLAIGCAAACVAAIAFFVSINMPDISVRVTAMQTGIEATYPAHVPRDYSLSNVNSESNKVTMEFTNKSGNTFTLSEEKSSWDSNTLLNNYVKTTWKDNFITTREQGITIYLSNSNATWVNGGILYKLEAPLNNLTKKQIRSIVISL